MEPKFQRVLEIVLTSLHQRITLNMMRTTVTIDEDVYEAASRLAKLSGERLGKVLSELARRGLQLQNSETKKRRFPVFSVPANAPVIPASRIQRILEEDWDY